MLQLYVLAISLFLAIKYASNENCTSDEHLLEAFEHTVDLRGRHISSLHTLPTNASVYKLLLDQNLIEKIHQLYILPSLKNLTYLSLCKNRIKTLFNNSFPHLQCLLFLDLRQNPFAVTTSTLSHVFKSLPSIKVLKIPNGKIPIKALPDLHQLEELHLGLTVSTDTILPVELLTLLELKLLNFAGGNVPAITRTLLDNLRNSTVQEISFRNSKVQSIQLAAFANFRYLNTINLACNHMVDGFDAILHALADLGTTPLDTLIMDHVNTNNYPVTIKPEHLCTDIGKVTRLSMKSNKITGIHKDIANCIHNLDVLSIGYHNYPDMVYPLVPHESVLSVLLNSLLLKTVDISYLFVMGGGFHGLFCNADSDIRTDDFFPRPLISFPLVSLPKKHHNQTFGKDVFDFTPFPTHLEHFKGDNIGLNSLGIRFKMKPFPPNNSIKVFDLSHNKFFKEFPLIRNLFQLQIADMSYNSLEQISDEAVATLETSELRYLNISHNRLYQSNPNFKNTFRYLPKLVFLDLSHNGLTTIHPQAFASNAHLEFLHLGENNFDKNICLEFSSNSPLKILGLSNNAFQYLSGCFTQQLDKLGPNVAVNISANPFVCDCNSVDFVTWFQASNVIIVAKLEITCLYKNTSVALSNVDVSVLKEECNKELDLKSILPVAIVPFIFMLLTITSLYKLRWHIRWHYYSFKRRWRPNNDDQLELPFNAYVIFNEERDLSFVYQTIRPAFEDEERCRLFLNGRDDLPGNTKGDNVIEGLNCCSHVLAIVTSAFLEDEMCEFAINMAVVKGIRSLVVLMVNDPDLSSASSTLRGVCSPRASVPKFDWPHGISGQRLVISELLELMGTAQYNMTII